MHSVVVLAPFHTRRSHMRLGAVVLGGTGTEHSHCCGVCPWTCQTAGVQSRPLCQASSAAPSKFGGATSPHPSGICLCEQTCGPACGLCSGRSTAGRMADWNFWKVSVLEAALKRRVSGHTAQLPRPGASTALRRSQPSVSQRPQRHWAAGAHGCDSVTTHLSWRLSLPYVTSSVFSQCCLESPPK